jgi:lipoprotein NlpD
VVRGDTLFAIAWRYGIDYREIARLNNIARPYTIYPGQRIALKGEPSNAVPVRKAVPGKAVPGKAAPSQAVTNSSPPRVTRAGPVNSDAPVSAWRWPTEGKVTRGFSGTVHKGVDIGGKTGDPVRATAAGKVVYAGSGIVGYGKLLIVKHNDIYLSAYGHNQRLLVDEGETVGAGQQIAEKGSTGTNAVKLHFEIRREGRPVDPTGLLPSR